MILDEVAAVVTAKIAASVAMLRTTIDPLPERWSRKGRSDVELMEVEHPDQEGSVWGWPTARTDRVLAYLGDEWLEGYRRAGDVASAGGHFVGRYLAVDAGQVTRAELLRVVLGVYVDGVGDDWEYVTSLAGIVWDNGVGYVTFDQSERELVEERRAQLGQFARTVPAVG